jgi:hypothetical protein
LISAYFGEFLEVVLVVDHEGRRAEGCDRSPLVHPVVGSIAAFWSTPLSLSRRPESRGRRAGGRGARARCPAACRPTSSPGCRTRRQAARDGRPSRKVVARSLQAHRWAPQ